MNVTSKYGKKYNYDYYSCTLYLNKEDPYQSKCIDLLKKAGKKKSQFLAILINQFLSQFNDPDNITDKDFQNYLNYFELSSKMKNAMPPMMNIPAGMSVPMSQPLQGSPPVAGNQPTTVSAKETERPTQDEADPSLIAAMSIFNV